MTAEKSPSPGARLRASYADGCIAMPGVFNALVAMMAERAGFEGIYSLGRALSAASGLPDIGLLSMSEFVEQVRVITAASSLPLLVDADTGFGGSTERGAGGQGIRACRGGRHPDRGPAAPQAMRSPLGKIPGQRRGDGAEDPRRRERASRPGVRDRRPDRRPRGRGLRSGRRACPPLPGSRGRRHLSRSAARAGRSSPISAEPSRHRCWRT